MYFVPASLYYVLETYPHLQIITLNLKIILALSSLHLSLQSKLKILFIDGV